MKHCRVGIVIPTTREKGGVRMWTMVKLAACAAALTASVLTTSAQTGTVPVATGQGSAPAPSLPTGSEPAVDVQPGERAADAPQRVSQTAVPATIAFIHNKHLWILDASKADAVPVQVTTQGEAEIAGWSADGKWLLYLLYEKEARSSSSPAYLWAVKADGTGAFQVDVRPVLEHPKWSPVSRTFAYLVAASGADEDRKKLLVVAEMAGEKAGVVSTQTMELADFAWMPDGKRLLVSVPVASDRPMTLRLIDLAGNQLAVYPLTEQSNVDEDIYPLEATGLKVAPDGKRVAYYVWMNAASLSNDGVPIQILDLTRSGSKPVDIGSGLAYPQWLAWSPDSSLLAFIDGEDRMATHNKRVMIADANGRVIPAGQPDKVDAQPTWTAASPYTLYFTRGVETYFEDDPENPKVPGQRIWRRSADGSQQAVTQGTDKTADIFPTLSPDGNALLFVRLDAAEHGSLYLKTGSEREVELLRHVTGSVGFYGNHLPAWISVFWKEQKPH
ncbi:MAG: hypothetical protein DF221_15770 [Brevibacillus sp.]|jgi:Tol biopolymer transport system component|nr:MAG: hypothetical protein DF221_15770 [Brevibacillus sp.]